MENVGLSRATPYERFQWFRVRQNPNDPGLTISYAYELTGDIDVDRLDAALRKTVETTFPRLLTYFTEVGDALVVRTRPVPRRVLRKCERADEIRQAARLDATGEELFRFSYWQGSPGSLTLRLDFSHLVFDGGCYAPFCDALSACWQGVTPAGEPRSVPQNNTDPESYWRATLPGRPLHQPLPFAYPSPYRDGRHTAVRETLDGERAEEIYRFLRRGEVSLLQFVVGVTGALVHAYDDEDTRRIVVAHTVDTRKYGAPYGCHTNLVPLWLDVSSAGSGRALLDQVGAEREELAAHQDFPTLDLLALAASTTDRPADRGSAFNLVVNSSSAMLPTAVPELPGVTVTWVRKPDTASSSDLAVNFSADAEGIHLSFDSTTRLMSPAALSAFATNFLRLARFVATRPDEPLARCDLSRQPEPVAEGPSVEPDTLGLGARLVETARRHADRVAVLDDERVLSYRELLAVTHRLATEVSEPGPVGVFLTRSAAIPAAYLTALVLRRTFVPLDPQLPDPRLEHMGTAADLRVVFVDAATRDRAAHLFPHTRLVEVDVRAPVGPAPEPETAPADQDRTAYVMFTSGSTGVPKGVALSEGNLANFLRSVRDDPGMGPEDRILALTPVSFDISLLELLLPLLCGASVEVLTEETGRSGDLLAERIENGAATVVQATPSTWRILRAVGWQAGRPMTLLCGGEALDADLAEYLLSQRAAVHNMYGPTEATIWASWQRVTDPRHVHLGTPAHNTGYYVVDAAGRSVPPGMRGELVIAGDCVGKGYLNAPPGENPFHTLPDGSPAYRTGDVVHYAGPGHVTYVSRTDGQRKVNGYRVELGEVAAGVRGHAPSATVFAVVRTDPEPHLRCFVWLPAGEDFDAEAARAWCERTLPHYLVPRAIHRLREIPLTANGKADVKRLTEASLSTLDLPTADTAPEPNAPEANPRDDLVAELRRLVADELRVPAPDIDQPLGYQGVTSLGYNILSARIGERYGVVVHAHDFYRLNTVRNVAATVARLRGDLPVAETREPEALTEPRADDRLAIVGLSAVLPGGDDAAEFWEALLAGVDAVGPAAPQRGLPGEHAGFLRNVKGFDARFFAVSPLEASWLDPRQRLMLQSAWHTLEDAGYAPAELRGTRTGCYLAATGADYALLQARANAPQMPYSLVGHSMSLIANRVSSFFDWHGPSATLDTACSGSLVALVRACRDLRAGVCDAAVVGGVNLILDTQINEGLHAARFLSPDHRCASFDAAANGYVRGEGYGTFLVKRLADAVAAGDDVLAVVESVAENHGGRANSLTAPNPNAQYELLLDAYTPELAARTSYVEAHGTGTTLGDAIEVDALTRAWQHLVPGEPASPVWLGAVKSNIGHLEPAAGVASVAKVVKAFEHRTLPANLHFQELNPEIMLAGTPFEVLAKTVPWTTEPMVAGVSSFGFGGTNAHVVLSAPPHDAARRPTRSGPYLIPLSARTPRALRALVARLAEYAERAGRRLDERLLDLSYTLCHGREHFEHRLAWVVDSAEDLVAALRGADGQAEMTGEPTRARDAYLAGQPVEWQALFAGQEPRRLHLPTYPFDEANYWFTD